MSSTTPDAPGDAIFVDRMAGILNDAALALMTSIGHRTGLFDALAALTAPVTSEQLAAAAGLNERYVREWLGAMAAGRIVAYDPGTCSYSLPAEHAAALTRAAGTGNLAIQAEYIALLGGVEDAVVQSFRAGGGVPYERYPRFQQLMAEDSGAVMDGTLLQATIPLVPGLEDRLRAGIRALDVGCGRGHAVNLLARAFPASQFVGYDFSESGIAAARDEASRLGLANATFEVRNLDTLDASNDYDLITAFDVIHDQAHPRLVLANVRRALKPGVTFLMVDIAASSDVAGNLAHPLGPFMYTMSCMHCMTVSLALDGEGLGAMWGEEKAQELLRGAGFTRIDVQHLPDDIFNTYYVASC